MMETDQELELSDTNLEEGESKAGRFCKQLDTIRKQLKGISITASVVASNPNYKKMLAKGKPILSLDIPNSLLLLWSKTNKIESKLKIPETPLIKLTAASIARNFISLGVTSATLMEQLINKQVGFLVNNQKNSGAYRRKLQQRSTNTILLKEEIASCSIENSQVAIQL